MLNYSQEYAIDSIIYSPHKFIFLNYPTGFGVREIINEYIKITSNKKDINFYIGLRFIYNEYHHNISNFCSNLNSTCFDGYTISNIILDISNIHKKLDIIIKQLYKVNNKIIILNADDGLKRYLNKQIIKYDVFKYPITIQEDRINKLKTILKRN